MRVRNYKTFVKSVKMVHIKIAANNLHEILNETHEAFMLKQ
jgi:hypothetical protein